MNTSNRRAFLKRSGIIIAASPMVTLETALMQGDRSEAIPTEVPYGRIRSVKAGVLDVGYVEDGPSDGPVVILLHGWPYDIHSYIDVVPILALEGYRVIVPYVRGYGSTTFISGETPRNGQQAVLAVDLIHMMDALHINKAILAGFDWGSRTANIVAALWPERCKAMVAVSGYLINNRERNKIPLPPAAEYRLWYQYYFATERGRAGYETYHKEFAKLIWKNVSPNWRFDEATFERTAQSFQNPDHASVVVHNYRWRLGLAEGERQYDEIEEKLAGSPVIDVPSITLDGDSDTVLVATDGSGFADKFSGPHTHRIISGGHNLPAESPLEFAAAILEVDRY